MSQPIQFAICNEIFKGWDLETTFRFAAQTGYDAVEIAPFTLSNAVTDISMARRREIAALAQAAGIAISGIHWVLVKPEGMYINHTDAEVRDKTARYFVDLVDFCADIGGRTMVVGSPKQRNVMEGVTHEQAWQWALDTFAPAVKQAAQRGVTICLEPLSPVETNFINTAEEALKFVRQLNSPAFKIILDVKAMSSESKSIPTIIRESWSDFAYFHANDKNLKGPGFGDVDFGPIARELWAVGYRGYVSVEVFVFDEGPEVIARESLRNLRRAFYPASQAS